MEPFLGQLMLFPFNYAPKGWAQCNGQLLAINQFQALFALLGTTFGGNGTTNFALPNLQGRTPVGTGGQANVTLGQTGGEEQHTLSAAEVPPHSHRLQAVTSGANQAVPNGNLLATTSGAATIYNASGQNPTQLNLQTISTAGGGQPHENRTPYLVMNWCIALVGIFPSQN
jgi:microcystin-dependent protein